MKKFLILYFLLSFSICFSEQCEPISAIYLVELTNPLLPSESFPRPKVYKEGIDGKFNVQFNKNSPHLNSKKLSSVITPYTTIQINFINFVDVKNYCGSYSAYMATPGENSLIPGVYKNFRSDAFEDDNLPSFMSGPVDPCEATFEILDIQFDVNGNVCSFAVDYFQKCESSFYVYGSIRYNSCIPLKESFTAYFEPANQSSFYFVKHDLKQDEFDELLFPCTDCDIDEQSITQKMFVDHNEASFEANLLPYGGEGIEVIVNAGEKGVCFLNFISQFNCKLTIGYDDYKNFYPNNFFSFKSISAEDCFVHPDGYCRILTLERDEKSNLKSLVANFKIVISEKEVIVGALRYNSKIKIDFNQPYNWVFDDILPNLSFNN